MNVTTAYQRCEEITRAEAHNFSYGIRLLPREQRQALSAVYATARRIDDIGDGDGPAAERERALEALRACLGAIEGRRAHPRRLPTGPLPPDWSPAPSSVPGAVPLMTSASPPSARDDAPLEGAVLTALADAAERLPIPLDAFDDLVDGCLADVEGRRYETFEEVVGYCRQVAGSVGRLSVGVYNPLLLDDAEPLADDLGVALQLTNILRDLREDRLMGRVYLPQEDLDRFGCTLAVGLDGAIADPPRHFDALVRFEARRAEAWYARGLTLLPLLDRRSAACTAAMAGIYHRLLGRIAAEPSAVRGQRLSLSTSAKVSVAVHAIVRGAA
ncbi:phytoene synthase [Intrasporangium chromatireducens Q5-1]|uniref:Phytoene synthase n=1 Tax=Intrasporangium chromatireducens Q5-1 TaxID=584657 RepID=W9GVI9_9MICO|nr:squalene/phytoene synthase family protein [Intrasporangium chromatireducens]EWT07894.1 phytoene synthase [Intrasporangium chromatireducens Q5-1]